MAGLNGCEMTKHNIYIPDGWKKLSAAVVVSALRSIQKEDEHAANSIRFLRDDNNPFLAYLDSNVPIEVAIRFARKSKVGLTSINLIERKKEKEYVSS